MAEFSKSLKCANDRFSKIFTIVLISYSKIFLEKLLIYLLNY